jgi:hypothetical protein
MDRPESIRGCARVTKRSEAQPSPGTVRRKRGRWKSRETLRKSGSRPGKLAEVEDLAQEAGGQEALSSHDG